MSPMKTTAPLESLSSILCGVPGSWFEKAIVNALFAGPVHDVWVKATPLASTVTSAVPPPEPAAADPPGALDPSGAADPPAPAGALAAGAAEPPAVGPVADGPVAALSAKTPDWR